MSFVHKDPNPLRTPQEVAGVCLQVARERGLDDFAAVLAVMCITAETGFWCPWNRKDPTSENYEHDSESDDGRSVGYFQQQNKTAGEIPTPDNDWWGPMAQRMGLHESCNEFLSRLEDNYMEALEDPVRAGEFVQHVQGSAFPDGSNYRPHYDSAAQLVNAAASGAPPSGGDGVGFTGDPVWLEDVLREALGDRLVVENDADSRWDERGTGGTIVACIVCVCFSAASAAAPTSRLSCRSASTWPLRLISIRLSRAIAASGSEPSRSAEADDGGGVAPTAGEGEVPAGERLGAPRLPSSPRNWLTTEAHRCSSLPSPAGAYLRTICSGVVRP